MQLEDFKDRVWGLEFRSLVMLGMYGLEVLGLRWILPLGRVQARKILWGG